MKQNQRLKSIWNLIAGLIVFILLAFLSSCSANSAYEMKITALRVLDKNAKPVGLSFWIFDGSGKQISTMFISGKLDPETHGSTWLEFDSQAFTAIPADAVSLADLFEFQIKLNPNRLATPPDAIFTSFIDLREFEESNSSPGQYIIKSDGSDGNGDGGRYELSIQIQKRQ